MYVRNTKTYYRIYDDSLDLFSEAIHQESLIILLLKILSLTSQEGTAVTEKVQFTGEDNWEGNQRNDCKVTWLSPVLHLLVLFPSLASAVQSVLPVPSSSSAALPPGPAALLPGLSCAPSQRKAHSHCSFRHEIKRN